VNVFFLSDIHLRNGRDLQSERLVNLLATKPAVDDIVILGGDIFDLLVGDKRVFRKRFTSVLWAIEAAAKRGVMVYYLEGNHDFHFSDIFANQSGVKVCFEDFSFSAHNRRIWVSHGDLIDSSDYGYRFLRWITKNKIFKLFVSCVPDFFVDIIGNSSSRRSRDYTIHKGSELALERVRNLYLNFAKEKIRTGFDHVLVGHSHLRDQVVIKEGPYLGEYVNLGFAADRLYYAVLERGSEKFEMKEIS